MPPAKKPAARKGATTPAARARAHQLDVRRLDRVAKALDTAQKDLSALGGNLGSGAKDLRTSVTRLLRDSRRDLSKMQRALQGDLDRLQKDLAAAAKRTTTAARKAPVRRAASKRATTKSAASKRAAPKRTAGKSR